MSDTSIVAFLGDRDRTFDLLPHLGELERIVGAGTGAILKRVVAADFRAVDIPTIVRLALIGGGETPKDAAALVATYITGRPLSEGHELATAILMAVWSGNKSPYDDPNFDPAKVEPVQPDGFYERNAIGDVTHTSFPEVTA